MTLYRQISIFLLLLLLAGFCGTLYLGMVNLQGVYEQQLASHAQDTATSLGLMLSTPVNDGDKATVETVVNAAFDRGDFLSIEVTALDGSVIAGKTRALATTDVPGWFVRLLSINVPPSQALVMAGWKQAGVIRISADPSQVYVQFWHNATRTLEIYLAVTACLLLLAMFAVRMMLRPLTEIRKQAEAICDNRFPRLEITPGTRELRSVVAAMNRLSDKVNEIFTEQSALTEAMREQVYMDPLTGVGNRRYFDRILPALVEDQDQISTGALLLIELHNLTRLNDTSGYPAGDKLLHRAAQLIQLQIRDVENCYLARLSGASFAVIAVGMPDESADELAVSINRSLFQLRADGLVSTNDIGHIGIAMWTHGYRTSDLLSEADMALRAARVSGQNTWQRYRTYVANQADIYGAGRWRSHIQSVIETGNIQLVLQPVIITDGESADVFHHEVFTRIPDPGGSGIHAGLFMPMAERLGMASQLDKLTVNTLLDQIRSDNKPQRTYALNLSSTSLHDTVFIQWLYSTLSRHQTLARRIMLEFPEYGATANLDNMRSLVERVSEFGIQCGIDHFGRGFSTYGYLQSAGIRYLKLDASHILNIGEDRDSQFFIRSLTDTMHSIDIKVFALAVESDTQKEILRTLHIDGVQGYLLGKPAPLVLEKSSNIRQE